MELSFLCGEKEFKLNLKEIKNGEIQVSLDKQKYDVSVEFVTEDEFLLKVNGKVYDVIVHQNSGSYDVCMGGKSIRVDKKSPFQLIRNSAGKVKRAEVKTSMPGRVVELLMKEGDEVREEEPVLVLEAMKMQNEIKSPQKGKVKNIFPKPGDSVEAGAVLFTVE